MLAEGISSSFEQNNYVVLDALEVELFMKDDEKVFKEFESIATLTGEIKYIPGDAKGANRRFYLHGLHHKWIDETLIPRIKTVCGNLIPPQCTSVTYTIIYGGNSFQEPHHDGSKPGVSFLFSIKDYSENLYILNYDPNSYNKSENTIEFSKLEFLKYFCVMFKSEQFLHGGGIHSADDPRIFIHFQENASDKDFILLQRKPIIKIEKTPKND